MTARATRNQGKSMFVKEHLHDNPTDNHRAVNAAWEEAGMPGTISPTLVSRVRTRMGLAGKSRGGRRVKAKGTGARRGRRSGPAPVRATASVQAAAPVQVRGRKQGLMALEVELDRLLMKVAAIGTLPEVEESLRQTRRELYAGLAAKD